MLGLKKKEEMIVDLPDVEWEQKIPRSVGSRKPTVRISKYSSQGAQINISIKAVEMILGNQQDCSVVLGLSRDRKDLYIKIANTEDEGSRLVKKTGKANTFAVQWLGAKLGLTMLTTFSGELIMMNRDMFIVELVEEEKKKIGAASKQ